MTEAIIVPEQTEKKRLDVFLSEQKPGVTRGAIQRAIKRGDVSVAGKTANSDTPIKPGMEITIAQPFETGRPLAPTSAKTFSIIFEDDNFLVIDKPTGLLVHPDSEHDTDTLVNQLLAYYPPIAGVGSDPLRPGIVHRLDREVSGIMVVAKTIAAYDHLKNQFEERAITKEYRAVVYGTPQQASREISFTITRSRHQPNRMAARPDESGKEAVTAYELIKTERNRSLLRVITKTGRTHQVRVHLFAIGHPIVGDKLYHGKKPDRHAPPRILLHAHTLCFTDLAGTQKCYTSPLPGEATWWLS